MPDEELEDEEEDAPVTQSPPHENEIHDKEIIAQVLEGNLSAFELLMRRYNQRLFRISRSIVGDDGEAEDVVQETYVRAFEHLGQYTGQAAFSTWLTKIALHEALARRSRRQRQPTIDLMDPENRNRVPKMTDQGGEFEATTGELRRVLTAAVDELPDEYRTVFTMRVIEGLNTEETAICLDLTAANVKVRLHRARSLLRERIDERLGIAVRQLYQFGGDRCDRIVHKVLTRLSRAGLITH